jgi:hypothetical protein
MSDTGTGFDFDGWLEDATRLRRSVLIYKRPDLIARLDEISQSMETARTVGLNVGEYIDEWEVVAQHFADSALRVTFEHRTEEEVKAVIASCVGSDLEEQQAALLADSVVDPVMSKEQALKLRSVIGDGQIIVLVECWTAVCFGEIPLNPEPTV